MIMVSCNQGNNNKSVETAMPMEYEQKLFDKSYVHTIDIQMEDWDSFIEEAPKENYVSCNLLIDGESFENIAIRAKGNNSKRLTEKYGLERYSLKVEFDHYYDMEYYGLDKFSLASSFQDNSYLKTWLAYDMFIAKYFENGYFEGFVSRTVDMISPYVKRDPTAFCSYEDFLLGAETLTDFCCLRAQSVRGQLDGEIPSTIKGQTMDRSTFVDASSVWLPDMGEIADLKD